MTDTIINVLNKLLHNYIPTSKYQKKKINYSSITYLLIPIN